MEYFDLVGMFEKSVKSNWDCDALSDYKGITLQYKDVARKIEKLHIMFEAAGIVPEDKIALCGRNSANWAVAFMAAMTYGCVPVPILHEFKPDQVQNIVNHSEARLLFVGDVIAPKLDLDAMPTLEGAIHIPDYSLLLSKSEKLSYARENLNLLFGQKYPKFFRKEHVHYHPQPDGEKLALINYTSGTTGKSKGAMIPYRAIWSNIYFGHETLGHFLKPGQNVVSMLPLAHMYGLVFEFLLEFSVGMHVNFLTRIPSPRIIFQAFGELKPHLVIAVPLIIEKIIRKAVLPQLQTSTMKMALRVPMLSEQIYSKVRDKLYQAFGGNLYSVIVGGAAFNSEIEEFLKRIKFPFTVGFGTTETAPLAAYEDYHTWRAGSCGRAVPRMEARINSSNPQHEVGEILFRGANVMLGYFKNPEATEQAIDKNGWYHTGDLGVMDADGFIYIRGRSKNMLLSSSGQNVYPEEVEDKFNTLPFVAECVMIQKGEKFHMLVYPDFDAAAKEGLDRFALQQKMEENRKFLNTVVNPYEQIVSVKIMEQEFEKTPKRSIKRYLYADAEV